MTEIFTVEEYKVIPTKEILLIPEYAYVWNRDTSVGKEKALRDFAYVYFLISMRKDNIFRAYNEDVKSKKIIERISPFEKDWIPDEHIEKLCKIYLEDLKRSSMAYSYLMAAKIGAEKVKKWLQSDNILTLTNFKTGALLYKPKDITSALSDTLEVITKLQSWETKVMEDELTSGKDKNKEANYFEE